ncbi:MAG: tRNA-dihydrouridine synthase family protein, partial [Kiritimatiellia bacterium]
MASGLWLAPLRGVTVRAFRDAFAEPIREAGFDGAFAPFIPANPGIRVNDRLLADLRPFPAARESRMALVPQVISRHPAEMRELLKGFKDRGFERADLNAGCPFPMIRRRGRGAGLLRTPDVLEALLEAGCAEMGPGRFSLKVRLGLDREDDLANLLPMINRYPLAALTIHARTARQMYGGAPLLERFVQAASLSANPVLYNGDATVRDGACLRWPAGACPHIGSAGACPHAGRPDGCRGTVPMSGEAGWGLSPAGAGTDAGGLSPCREAGRGLSPAGVGTDAGGLSPCREAGRGLSPAGVGTDAGGLSPCRE